MVLENSDLRTELFPTSSQLVPNDPSKTFRFTLSDEEVQNDIIERMYGPFTNEEYTRPEESAMLQRQQQIDNLKKLIAERQARNVSRTASAPSTPPVTDSSSKPILQNKEEPIKVLNKPSAPIVIIDDSDEDMVVESEEEENPKSDPMSTSSVPSPTERFYTAHESFEETEQDEMEILDEKLQRTIAELERLTTEKEKVAERSRQIRLQLLGMKVRMSLGKNKDKSKNKSQVLPHLGEKRNYNDFEEIINHRSRRRFEYTQPDYNYTSTNSFYQPSLSMHNYIPPMNYLPHHLQPPPPPTELPPFTPPPPPPPPPSITPKYPVQPSKVTPPRRTNPTYKPNVPKHKQIESSNIEPMKNLDQIESTLRELEQFISVRIFNDKSDYPIIENRSLPRPLRLITVDKYTMTMNMIILNQNTEPEVWKYPSTKFKLPVGLPVETEMDESWYESPFFIMLRRKASSQRSNTTIQPAIDAILNSIKPFDDLSSIKIGSVYFVSLEDTLNVARIYYHQNPTNEFFASLKLELSFYVNGNSSQFQDDYKESISQLSLSVDVEWQRIRAEVTFSNQLPLILNLLHRISAEHTTFDSKDSLINSSMTTEVLIRLLRLNGLQQVLRLMTNKEIDIDTEKLDIFDINDSPGLYLQEQDKYCIWMLILYFYVNKSIPDFVCNNWMNSLVKDGTPNKHMSIFMIDWTLGQLLDTPLDRATLFGATNILLSMLRHFGNKACNDIRRKSLLVGTWRTLSSFLSNTPCYKTAGTLMLMRNASNIINQIPEIQEIITDLEIKAESSITIIIDHIYQSKRIMSLSNIHSLCYHIARSYYEKYTITNHNLLIMANILLYPLLDKSTKSVQSDLMKKLTLQTEIIQTEQIIIMVDSIRQRYLTALGIDFALVSSSRNIQQTNQRKISFAWINLLLLTGISKFLYPESSIIRDSLDKNIKLIFEEAMKEIKSEDGKVAIFKYANLLTQNVTG